MKRLKLLGTVLSKQEMKKIVGGYDNCPSGTHSGCHLLASSCGPEAWEPNCRCNDATWYCQETCETYCHN